MSHVRARRQPRRRGDDRRDPRGRAARLAQSRVLDLAARRRYRVLAGVIEPAGACVSNDSGAMHLAAAAGVPVVGDLRVDKRAGDAPLARAGVRAEVVTQSGLVPPLYAS